VFCNEEEARVVEFDLTDEQEGVRELARSIGAGVVSPEAKAADSDGRFSDVGWSQLLATGLVAPVPTEFGGGGLPDTLSSVICAEELGFADVGIAASALWSGNAAVLIGLCGTEQQCRSILPAFIHPEGRASVAHYEGYGRSPSDYQTTIEPEGNGAWRIRGQKVAVPFAAVAKPIIVVGHDRTAGGRLRAAVLADGVDSPQTSSPGPYIGLDVTPLATVTFDITVDTANVLGGVDSDAAELSDAVSRIRLATAGLAIGCAQRAREYASQYATERTAFGKAIASFQGVAFLMAEAQMQIDAARLEIWKIAAAIDEGGHLSMERPVSMAVNYATNVATMVTRDAIQVLGGHGFLADHPVERWYRAAAGLATLDFDPTCSAFAPAL
jgi:alkylation response protein AidB-like acyl-CoA dehydrogenase